MAKYQLLRNESMGAEASQHLPFWLESCPSVSIMQAVPRLLFVNVYSLLPRLVSGEEIIKKVLFKGPVLSVFAQIIAAKALRK